MNTYGKASGGLLQVRFKVNQKSPTQVDIPQELIPEGWLSYQNLATLLAEKLFITDLSRLSVFYLSEDKTYVPIPTDGVFLRSRTCEIYLHSPPGYDFFREAVNTRVMKDTQLNGAMSDLRDRMNKIQHLMTRLAESLNLSLEDNPAWRAAMASSLTGQDPSNPEYSNLVEEMEGDIDEQGQSAATHSSGKPKALSRYGTLNFVKTTSMGPLDPRTTWQHLPDQPTFKSSLSMSMQPNKRDLLHMAIVYSDPMVEVNQKSGQRTQQCQTMNEPVDFYGESTAILKCLEKKEKNMKVHIECATIDQFVSILKKEKPRIMHIMCHGDYDSSQQEFYLQFENEQAELFKLYPSMVKQLFAGTDFSETKLIFINACHSEMVGRAFLDLGVACVIVAQSQMKINDEFATKFSELFYDELIYGHTIQVAFKNAKNQLKASSAQSSHSCCCGHKHKPDCNWIKELNKNGKEIAHDDHVPKCDCPNKMSHWHKMDCGWADDFILDYDILPVDDEKKGQFVCCCSPELTHDETMKTLLLEKDEGVSSEICVLENLMPGKVLKKGSFTLGENKFRNCATLGRNKVIYDFFNAFTIEKCSIVYLCGPPGSGKTMVSKHIANYMMERHKISDVQYMDRGGVASVAQLLANLPEASSKGFNDGPSTLFILDNMELCLKNRFTELHNGLKDVMQRVNLKFLIICTDKRLVKSADNISAIKEKVIELKPLNPQWSATLLKQMVDTYLPWALRSVFTLSNHKVCSTGCTPKAIIEIAQRVKQGKSLEQIAEEMSSKQNGEDQVTEIQAAFRQKQAKYLESLKAKLPDVFKLIPFISHFKNGLLDKDLTEALALIKVPCEWYSAFIFICFSTSESLDSIPLAYIQTQANELIKKGMSEHQMIEELREGNDQEPPVLKGADIKINDHLHYLVSVEDDVKDILLKQDFRLVDILEQQLNVLKYYYFLFRSAIRVNGVANTYLENTVECTVLNSNKRLWGMKMEHPDDICYITSGNMPNSEVREIMKHHQNNIGVLLSEEFEFSFKKGLTWATTDTLTREKDYFIKMFVEFMLGLFTICKMFDYYAFAKDFVDTLRKLDVANLGHERLLELELKAELFACDINYRQLFKSRDPCTNQAIEIINVQFKTVEKLLEKLLSKEDEWFEYAAEFYIVKIYTLRHDKMSRSSKTKDPKEVEIQASVTQLKKIYDRIKDKPELEFLTNKVLFVTLDVNIEKNNYNEVDIKNLNKGAEVFGNLGAYRLQCKAYQCLADAYKQHAEKSIGFAEQALKLVSKYTGLKEMEKPLRELEAQAKKKIKEKYHNKFYFLNSYPLKDQPNPMSFGGLNFEKSMKTELLDTLVHLNKEIVLNFDVFKEPVLDELLGETSGCKLLAIDFLYLLPDALVLEDPYFQAKTLTIDQIRAKLGMKTSRKANIDILMVVSDRPQPIIEKFAELCQIPLTIYFDFGSAELMSFNFYKEFLMRSFMYRFSLNFTNFICQDSKQTYGQAIDNAIDQSIDSLTNDLTRDYTVRTLKGALAEGFYSGMKKKIRSDEIFNFCKNSVRTKCIGKSKESKLDLKTGELLDATDRGNKQKFIPQSWFLRRDRLVVEVQHLLEAHTFVNIHCHRGYGKSVFLKQFSNEVSRRNIYPMGVYFLRMSELQDHISLKEVLLEQFGQHFEVDVEAYFKDMKKLVIIDDCDKLINYEGTSVSIRNRFLVALKNCNVPTILASKNSIPEVKEIGKIKTYPLPRLNNDESLMFLLTGEKELFEVESDISVLSKHEIILSARGKLGILRDQRKKFLDSISIKKKKRKRASDNYRVKGESESNSEDDDSDEDEVHQVYGKEADSPEIGSRKKQITQRMDGGYGRHQTRSPEVAKRSEH